MTWIRGVGGRIFTRALAPEQADRAGARFDHAQRLRELADELEQFGLDHARTDDR